MGRPITAKNEDRFFAKVNKDGPTHPYNRELGNCWLWTAGLGSGGYGQFWTAETGTIKSHRWSFFFHNGKHAHSHVLHSCDRPLCVNPIHLREGNDKDNVRDMIERGRNSPPPHYSGERNNSARLTEEEVRQIRELLKVTTGTDVANRYGISQSQVSNIRHGRHWKIASN